MTDKSDRDNSLKNTKNKLIDANFQSVKEIGLTSAKLIPYTQEIEHIRSIKPIPHELHIENLKQEINTIYEKVTSDSEDLDSYDGTDVYEGGSMYEER